MSTKDIIKQGFEAGNHLPITFENCSTFEQYQELGRMVQSTVFNHQWWAGDWLIFGEEAFPEIFDQAIEATGMAVQTLMNYRWVASVFPPERRCPVSAG